ncbi:uncharacterized protein PHACADRAFT_247984 [Phanerochaete carnosa HHB-10118-sp]|uniref:HMG box domain-containing protein n=1 Tax=Phanerochaete carnosa (strain HHB-10118-sp) TaxID=650164 RepID=K5XEE3_PHACS|nr:uncharacterized protein PHACADRAFT_247984 [Phanerochaete carnosa HHB-10118-sp]EKM61417.1 hypothetical protein PHACADRAFT_247984 [Phanerochaete carnosa HHB-10118-sp]
MVTTTTKTANGGATAQTKKRRASASGGRKKLTPFNKFMQTETARLKEEKPELDNKERFKMVIDNWNKQKEKAAA